MEREGRGERERERRMDALNVVLERQWQELN